jgi:hypothetical protein
LLPQHELLIQLQVTGSKSLDVTVPIYLLDLASNE